VSSRQHLRFAAINFATAVIDPLVPRDAEGTDHSDAMFFATQGGAGFLLPSSATSTLLFLVAVAGDAGIHRKFMFWKH